MDIFDVSADGHDAESPQGGGFYADDVPFRSGVIQEQSPPRMAYIAALNGFNPPRPEGHFRYCDLGCGNGTTLNALAAVYPEAEFVGIDFNQGHIAHAREWAERAGLSNVRFVQASFTELAGHDLPSFDFIGMNGIYSWLEGDPLSAVHRFLADHLRPGGLFYVEYMCMPGMIAVVPMWQLMQALVPDTGGSSHERATRALRLLEELTGGGMGYLQKHETARRAVRGYLQDWQRNEHRVDHFAHNALASGFKPRFVTEMCDEMASAGLVFGGRAAVRLNDPELSVGTQQLSVLRGVEDRQTRELLTDFTRNERNRRDVFVMGGEPDPEGAKAFLLDDVRMLCRRPAAAASRKLTAPGDREITLEGPGYDRLIAGFDGAARTPREVEMPEPVSDETLITAAHRLYATGEYFLCRKTIYDADWRDVPERLSMPLAMNRILLDNSIAEFRGNQMVAEATGGAAIWLGPLEAFGVWAWLETGRGGAADVLVQRFAERDEKVTVSGKSVPLNSLAKGQIEQLLVRLGRGKLRNMLRLGIVTAAD
ncbi:class I SAM-dependent methyltransferase [Ferruginivarius sediminum]|uniref:Methyltransferase domain-containing protein n=1 Tax=Ferruginivarius sediminum TaxID=2661937 RepID=A0A369TE88_9PROT|nr:class I SAM-dependent methyltransferase [Ferruginivarius sediminum]RDD63649.1 methyltransferase domain-containing protein [Ferruginivarius sediminum]